MSRLAHVLVCMGLTLLPARALACGGCFGPITSSTPTVVTGHRMAFAISETQTVLWDQFEYQGEAEDFSWVLPVRPGAFLELAADAWLSSLDTFTTTTVVSPTLNCAQPDTSSGCACGGMSADDSDSASGARSNVGGPNVTVVRHETVGPYETVVVRSDDPNAMTAWLTDNGYSIPDEIQPVIDAYVSEGNDFLALKLQAGYGVQQMEPVRVITPGGDYLLPLRMVAAGIGSLVDIKLFVIAEQRYGLPDLAEVSVLPKDVIYDFASNDSNYLALRSEALAQNRGKSYLVPYARRQAFRLPNQHPTLGEVAYQTSNGISSAVTLASLYFQQAAVDDGLGVAPCVTPLEQLDSSAMVVESCPAGGCSADQIPAANFACQEHSDLATALTGMIPANVWVTRIEMNPPSTALDADCVAEPSVAQAEVSPYVDALQFENPPCDTPLFSSAMASNGFALWLLASFLARWLGRRREVRS
jgi:hypothetical protein